MNSSKTNVVLSDIMKNKRSIDVTDLSASDKLQCWVTARNTIQKFDDILTKLSFQGLFWLQPYR